MESNAANTPETPAEAAPQPSALERRLDISVSIADLDKEIDQQLRKIGKTVKMPGFRPGKPTTDFIKKVLNKVTLFGAIYLGVVAILPLLIGKIVGNSSLSIGGTSVIIVVGVALETVQALESQMLMRQYKGFLE